MQKSCQNIWQIFSFKILAKKNERFWEDLFSFNFPGQFWQKFNRFFLPKSGRHFLPKSCRFLSNLFSDIFFQFSRLNRTEICQIILAWICQTFFLANFYQNFCHIFSFNFPGYIWQKFDTFFLPKSCIAFYWFSNTNIYSKFQLTLAILRHMQLKGTRRSSNLRFYWVSGALIHVHTKFQFIMSNRTRKINTCLFRA